ncbi:MAG: hypothetical protein EON58_12810 [Alphaproteobacteria bacterium]|nr:MAG: hypothetical protein EON58_12810 [Alphaproteobacteria bacterium]
MNPLLAHRALTRITVLTCIGLVLLAVIFANSGCHEPVPYTGMVCGKDFQEAHTDTTPITTMIGDVPITNYIETDYPDRWYLNVSEKPDACTGNLHDLQVTQQDYESAQIGQTRLNYIY